MRLRADQPEARNVGVVLLDNKPVPMCYEADEEEGWVKSYMPILPDSPTENGEEIINDDDTKRAGFTLVKQQGKVEIRFKNATSMDNS